MGLFSVASVGVLSLTKCVAISAARLGVRVNSVCLGMVEDDGSGGLWDSKNSGEAQNQLESMIPLGRLGRPSDAAYLVEFLTSHRASWIENGPVLTTHKQVGHRKDTYRFAEKYDQFFGAQLKHASQVTIHSNFPVLKMLGRGLSLASPICRLAGRISSEEYAVRRQRLVECARKAAGQTERDLVIVLKGARQSFIAPDVPGTYRQCSHFRYITGVTVPHCYYLIHAPANKANIHSILFMDKRTARQELWEGALPNESVLEATAGFDELLPTKRIHEVVAKMASSNSSLFVESSEWANTELTTIRTHFADFYGIKNHIDQLRLSKSAMEIESMRDVCTLGSKVVVSTIAGCRGFENESAIVGLLEFEARRRGVQMLAYPPVVAAGERANTIHYLEANQPIEKTDCVLMDAGCDFNGYVSDITRCYPISGSFSSVQRTLYDALLHVHEQLLAYATDSEKGSPYFRLF
ncbi:hypothetical protein KIN20_035580 [Parelaphostrongylus tenuis]|uniref:Aminopeptidase P N-terminal domain-containing protein n=1 Tax=Parelaphostrongylus tenuis TaxID=148309 RepID=A0AAD5RBM1_PARTN|nr:hypothetical protein KIN20_035580 [Parelaphostrongylus tenuis]